MVLRRSPTIHLPERFNISTKTQEILFLVFFVVCWISFILLFFKKSFIPGIILFPISILSLIILTIIHFMPKIPIIPPNPIPLLPTPFSLKDIVTPKDGEIVYIWDLQLKQFLSVQVCGMEQTFQPTLLPGVSSTPYPWKISINSHTGTQLQDLKSGKYISSQSASSSIYNYPMVIGNNGDGTTNLGFNLQPNGLSYSISDTYGNNMYQESQPSVCTGSSNANNEIYFYTPYNPYSSFLFFKAY